MNTVATWVKFAIDAINHGENVTDLDYIFSHIRDNYSRSVADYACNLIFDAVELHESRLGFGMYEIAESMAKNAANFRRKVRSYAVKCPNCGSRGEHVFTFDGSARRFCTACGWKLAASDGSGLQAWVDTTACREIDADVSPYVLSWKVTEYRMNERIFND